jgi:hypothetical protein
MEFKDIKKMYYERELTKCELKKREEIAKAMERENPGMGSTPEGMSKKMAIATAQAKKSCEESVESLDEVSNYDLVVNYYRHLGLDPYKLKGKTGKFLRDKIKNSPSFHAWLKANRYESVDVKSENSLIEIVKQAAKKSKKPDVTFYGYPGKEEKKQIKSVPNSTYSN